MYSVEVLRAVRDVDMAAIKDQDVARAAAEIVAELYENPWLGDPLRDRYNLKILEGCRRVRFDSAKRKAQGRPRYRLVYRLQGESGSPEKVVVLAIGERDKLAAYRLAAARLRRRRR